MAKSAPMAPIGCFFPSIFNFANCAHFARIPLIGPNGPITLCPYILVSPYSSNPTFPSHFFHLSFLGLYSASRRRGEMLRVLWPKEDETNHFLIIETKMAEKEGNFWPQKNLIGCFQWELGRQKMKLEGNNTY
jgi:hypothetical protein